MIKLYEDFEAPPESIDHEKTVEIIEDCFQDLKDDEFEITIRTFGRKLSYGTIQIFKILPNSEDKLKYEYEDIEECLLFALSYLKDVYDVELTKVNIYYKDSKYDKTCVKTIYYRSSLNRTLDEVKRVTTVEYKKMSSIVLFFKIDL